jgi:hypothetical protein
MSAVEVYGADSSFPWPMPGVLRFRVQATQPGRSPMNGHPPCSMPGSVIPVLAGRRIVLVLGSVAGYTAWRRRAR